MRDLDPTLPTPGGLTVTFVSPGGLALEPFADGYALMRVVAGHLHDSEDGLLAEVEDGREPVPWASLAARDEALATIRSAPDLDDDERRALLRHVLRTPYYERARGPLPRSVT